MNRVVIVNAGTHPELAHLAAELARRGELAAYVTGASLARDEPVLGLTRMFSERGRHSVERRILPSPLTRDLVKRRGSALEVLFKLLHRAPPAIHAPIMNARTSRVDRFAARLVRRLSPTIVVGQSASCERSLAAAREIGATGVLNYPLPHPTWMATHTRREARANPSFAKYLQHADDDGDVRSRATREIDLSAGVLVASTFVSKTFLPHTTKPCVVVPLGVASARDSGQVADKSRTFRVLYAGQITQRKGLSYLVEACQRLVDSGRNCELTLAGMPYRGMDSEWAALPWVVSTGPVSRQRLDQLYGLSDVFVLPTLADGFGLVILEAMSHGLPVIATEHSAGPDLLSATGAGIVVQAGNANALFEALVALHDDPAARARIGATALKSAERFTWTEYARQARLAILDLNELHNSKAAY